jgi:hypothetical protein
MPHLSCARAATRLGQLMTTIRGVVGALDAAGEIARRKRWLSHVTAFLEASMPICRNSIYG